ncbi:MFS transporter [Streptomyces sp. NBC_01353]|uniref:MFS transporter n=1 Tax=Streptomyces sp. NBC_01353 TaxID=2903835 RepID=UPI002E346E85|nr:MFS transporter [Streptomyces sp. NBC_01353]
MLKRLLPLALATFAVGTDGNVIAGLLPSIAADLEVSTPAAGQLVTAFALTLALSAPLMGALTSALDRRSALLIALTVFVIGNAVTALGTSYEVVMVSRIVTAVGAGIITAAASSTAAAIAPPERRGRALAFVLGGLTLATALGLPLGTLIGRTDWHITLWAVAGIGLLAAVGIAAGLPKVTLPAASLTDRLRPLKQGRLLALLAVTSLTFLGTYTLYTYIGPTLRDATSGNDALLTLILLAWGIGTLAGNITAGRLVDRYDSALILTGALAFTTLTLALTPLATRTLATTLVWAVVWGVTVGIIVVPQQHRLIALSPTAAPVLLGLNSSALYVGVALGGGFGGLAQKWLGLAPAELGPVAAGITALTFLWHLGATRRATTTAPMAPAAASTPTSSPNGHPSAQPPSQQRGGATRHAN